MRSRKRKSNNRKNEAEGSANIEIGKEGLPPIVEDVKGLSYNPCRDTRALELQINVSFPWIMTAFHGKYNPVHYFEWRYYQSFFALLLSLSPCLIPCRLHTLLELKRIVYHGKKRMAFKILLLVSELCFHGTTLTSAGSELSRFGWQWPKG